MYKRRYLSRFLKWFLAARRGDCGGSACAGTHTATTAFRRGPCAGVLLAARVLRWKRSEDQRAPFPRRRRRRRGGAGLGAARPCAVAAVVPPSRRSRAVEDRPRQPHRASPLRSGAAAPAAPAVRRPNLPHGDPCAAGAGEVPCHAPAKVPSPGLASLQPLDSFVALGDLGGVDGLQPRSRRVPRAHLLPLGLQFGDLAVCRGQLPALFVQL